MKNDIWAATEASDLDEAEVTGSPLLAAKVMMVDDEPLMTELIQAHLEDAGYNCIDNFPVVLLQSLVHDALRDPDQQTANIAMRVFFQLL